MKDIDWSKAPKWATRLLKNDGFAPNCWADNGTRALWITDNMTQEFTLEPARWSLVCTRPVPPQWNGAGLPPVGVVCEFMWNYIREGSEYVRVRVLAHDKGSAILRVVDGDNIGKLRESRGDDCGGHPVFRPVRTPEQIAADEREVAIKDMVDRFALHNRPDVPWYELFQQMYDCGCRMTAEDE